MRLIQYAKVIFKYKLEHLVPNSIFKNLGFVRNIFLIETVSGPLPFRVRKALEELGPVFIKIGQLLSTRQDIFPSSFITELKLLQDSVEPIVFDDIKSVIDSIPLDFKQIDQYAGAVGSIAQIHYAVLTTGEEVAIKILRPGIEKIIEDDFRFIKNSSNLINLYKPFKKVRLPEIVKELHTSIRKELDLSVEAKNIERFTDQMKKFSYLKIPKVYYANKNVLVLEKMYGTPIDQRQDLIDQNIDITKMLNEGLETFLLQAFYYGFFHADPHPGNVWIDKDGNRIYLDFGIMGEINRDDRATVLKLMIYIFNKRFAEIKNLITSAGWATSSLDGIEKDLEEIGNSLKNRKVKDLDMSVTLSKVIDTFNKYDVVVPSQLILLLKTLIAVDGFTKSLGPDYDVIKSIGPVLFKHFSKFS